MFESITKKRKNPLFNIAGWALLALVCLIFVFVGYSPDVDFGGSASSVASVNGDVISYADFSRYYERMQESRGGNKMTSEEQSRMRKEVVDSLVNRALILQSARADGILIGDEEIRDFLSKIPQFQDKGTFSVLKYKELLRAQGLNESRFEEKIAEDLLVSKMNDFYQQAAADDKLVSSQEDAVGKIKMNVLFVKKTKDQLVSDNEITTDEVAKYAGDNKSKISTYYKNNLEAEFTTEDQVKAQHILVKITPEFKEDQALKKIKDVASKLNAANFTEMAKKFSEDPGSKANGGDLGFFGKGRMVKEFEETAFKLEPGKISEPFKTSFGYHVLMVNDKKAKQVKTEDEVRDQIARKFLKEEKKDKAVKEIKEALDGGDAALEKLFAKKGWTWDETGPFSIGDMMIPKIGGNEEVLNAAMSVTKANPLYKDVVEKDGSYYLVKLKSMDKDSAGAAVQMSQNDFFKQIMERQKTYELFQAWMDQLRKDASIRVNQKILSQN